MGQILGSVRGGAQSSYHGGHNNSYVCRDFINDSIIGIGVPNLTASTLISVDKLMLFGILYTGSNLKKGIGNQCKALMFFHLINRDNLVKHMRKDSKRMKMLVYFMFELSQARLELERDGRQRIYFRERSGDFNNEREQLHQRIVGWLYGEFLR